MMMHGLSQSLRIEQLTVSLRERERELRALSEVLATLDVAELMTQRELLAATSTDDGFLDVSKRLAEACASLYDQLRETSRKSVDRLTATARAAGTN